jgi:guanine nucleotide-exchange factor
MHVLDVYLEEYDFTGIFYVNALKMMLSGFRLMGEGAIVDKMMEKFGEKFAADNPNGGPNKMNRQMSAEALYLVSYATMML